MCMNLCGTDMIKGVTKTGYMDDEATPMWVKPYAAAALMTGVLDAGEHELNSEATITCGEAMELLNSAMNITDVYCEDGANQAAANLEACRIVSEGIDSSAELTMGEAAEMLAGAVRVLDER